MNETELCGEITQNWLMVSHKLNSRLCTMERESIQVELFKET